MKTKSNLFALLSVACVAFLIFVQPYSTGYGHKRSALWGAMKRSYAMENGEWMFGYAVPLLVLGLLWMTRDRFKGLKVEWSALGIPILLVGFFLYFGGYKANQKYIGYVALHLMIAGGVIWHFGVRYFLKGLWLWILLGMMWPWIFLIPKVAFPLQKIMTTLTSGVLAVIGEDFVKEGTSIMSAPTAMLDAGERFSLKVAAACSGLRSFFALAMVSLFYGYITLKKDLNRLILFISSGVLAVLGNVVRMMLLYWGTLLFGKEFAIGKGEHDPSMYHIGAGLVVFVVALSGMIALAALLERGKKQKTVSRQV